MPAEPATTRAEYPPGVLDKAAIILHDAECGDQKCEPITMGVFYDRARAVLDAVVPLLARDAPCYCAETSTRNCPDHGNDDAGYYHRVLTAAFCAQRDFRAMHGSAEWDSDWDDEAEAIVSAVWPLIAAQAAATERRRLIAALREFLPTYVSMVIHARTPDGEPVYASGPVAFPDALVNTFALMTTPDADLLEGDGDAEADTCRPVVIDAGDGPEAIRVHGAESVDDQSKAALADIVGAARRRMQRGQREHDDAMRAEGAQAERERLAAAAGTPDELGALVRLVWTTWAAGQPDPKPSWLIPWADLDEGQREVDRRIGAELAARGAQAERRKWEATAAQVAVAARSAERQSLAEVIGPHALRDIAERLYDPDASWADATLHKALNRLADLLGDDVE